MKRYRAYFSGHVQGVGFRQTTVSLSRHHQVAGYVRNLPDGRVELVAEGQPKELDELLEDVKESMGEFIREVKLDKSEPNGEFGQPSAGGLSVKF